MCYRLGFLVCNKVVSSRSSGLFLDPFVHFTTLVVKAIPKQEQALPNNYVAVPSSTAN